MQRFLAFLLLTPFSVYASYLPLPAQFADKAVYHVKAEQLEDFSCGYNCLYNGCNMEQLCGIENGYSQYQHFQKECKKYIRSQGAYPKKSASTDIIDKLARKLHMQNVCNLEYCKKGKIQPVLPGKVTVYYDCGTPELEMKKKLDQAQEKKDKD